MLMLGRKRGESIVINGNVEVRVISVNETGYVLLGVDADKGISVHRKEIQDIIDSGPSLNKKRPTKVMYRRRRP